MIDYMPAAQKGVSYGTLAPKAKLQAHFSGWKVLVGPRDSSEIPKHLIEKWQP